MAQPLIVDTVRLEQAGATLRGLAVPEPPAPIAAAGSDSVSAAINETMPVVESPVTDGLPAVEVALAKTASSLAAAAGRYADTDHALGRPLAQQEFATPQSAAEGRRAASPQDLQASNAQAKPQDAPVVDPPPSPAVPSDVLPQVPDNAAQMGQQFNQIMGTAGSFTQSIFQSTQGAAQNQPMADQVLGAAEKPEADAEEQHSEVDEDYVDGATRGASAGPAYANSSAAPVTPPSADRAPLTAQEADR